MPNKLFISYPSESWNFAQRIAEKLAERLDESIFIDYRSIDQPDFAAAILTHLQASHAVLLIVTEFTFADIHRDRDWVRLEIRTALEHRIPIVLVRENGLLPSADLPDDVKDVQRSQGIPFYREYFEAGITYLTESLIKMGFGTPKSAGTPPKLIEPTPAPTPAADPEPEQRVIGGQRSLDEAADLLDAGDHDKALLILETLREQGNLRSVAAKLVADLIAEAQTRRAAAERRREASLDYETIAAMAKRKLTEASARIEFAAWRNRYPDLIEELDADNLRARFQPAPPLEDPLTGPAPLPEDELDAANLRTHFLPEPSPKDPIQRARAFKGKRNRDWEPHIATFPDLPIPDMPFCLVPVGTFNIGSDDGHYPNEQPVHPQTIPQPYWIAQYPVTNAAWRVAETAGAVKPPHKTGDALKWYNDPAMSIAPVVGVDWFMARDFAAWMGCRLLTELEWEYAARGVESLRYPWGEDWNPDIPVWSQNSGAKPAVVTTRPDGKSWVGALHLIGNVWEWTSSEYTGYQYRAEDGRERDTGNSTDVRRVLRGGSWWNLNANLLRAACRSSSSPDGRSDGGGFRLAHSLE